MKRSTIDIGSKSRDRGSTFATPRSELQRTSPLKPSTGDRRGNSTLKAGKGFACSVAQRERVADVGCVVCAHRPVQPAHLIDRSLVPDHDGDPRRVVPLCPEHHHLYDDSDLSILEYLEPRYRVELAHAVELVGLITALERITNLKWQPIEGGRADRRRAGQAGDWNAP